MKKRYLHMLGLRAVPQTLFEKLWLGAPIAVWFSFQPLLRIGKDSTMYFELSITLVYVAILALTGLVTIWHQKKDLLDNRSVQVVAAFVIISGLSLLWALNLTRAVLTLGVICMLFVVFLASIAMAERLKKLLPALVRIFIISAVLMSLLSIVQFTAGIWLNRDVTLLCAGCVSQQFGYPRPNVFTIEPQFLGNLLLAPALMLLSLFLTKRRDIWISMSLWIITTALCLTLSRGAIFSFGIGSVLLIVLYRHELKNIFKLVGILLAGFVTCLLMQGAAAALNPNVNETFTEAISKSVNQLSLGVIDIPVDKTKPSEGIKETPLFDGYVKESTDTRVSLSSLALRTWQDSPSRMLVGVGLGGSGAAMHEKFPTAIDAREIVQNEYLEILLEMGLVGVVLFVAIIAGLIYELRMAKWAWAIVLAYLVQWNFFSGYPNALHIYLAFIILAVVVATAHRGQLRPAKRY